MSPSVDFTLTDEHAKSYEQTLTSLGIKVFPKSRETVEDLEKGHVSHTTISGFLIFRDCEFAYDLYQNAKQQCQLSITAFEHNRDVGNALIDVVEKAYPQPEHGFHSTPVRKPDWNSIVNGVGCITILLFACAICFFALYGIRSFFK